MTSLVGAAIGISVAVAFVLCAITAVVIFFVVKRLRGAGGGAAKVADGGKPEVQQSSDLLPETGAHGDA